MISMFVDPFKNKRPLKKLNLLGEKTMLFEEIVRLNLVESFGAFENQYEAAMKIAEMAYGKAINGGGHFDFELPDGNLFNTISVDVSVVDLYGEKFEITKVNIEEKKVFLNIVLHKFQLISSGQDAIRMIYERIAHELMPGNILFGRSSLIKNGDDEDTKVRKVINQPEWYKAVLDFFEKEHQEYNWFGYAMYSTFYQETQAIISQVSPEIENKCFDYLTKNKGGEITKDLFLSFLRTTDAMVIYTKNISFVESITPDVEEIILERLKNYGVELDKNGFRRQCRYILKQSRNAIPAIYRNAMIAYKKYVKGV